jgi:hypothetical protein
MDKPVGPPEEPEPVPVRVLTRVVASGIVEHHGKKYLRATLSFLPEPVALADAGTVDLTRWPDLMEERVTEVSIQVVPVRRNTLSIQPDAGDAQSTTWTRTFPSRDAKAREDLTALWRRLMAPGPNDLGEKTRKILTHYKNYYGHAVDAFHHPWERLAAALTESISGKTVGAIKVPGTGDAGSTPVPNVMPVAHGIAAKSLAALKAHPAIQTIYDSKLRRVPEPQHAEFKLSDDPNLRAPSSKLGRLVVGGSREAAAPVTEQGWEGRAASQAMRRNVLVDTPQGRQALLKLLKRTNEDREGGSNSNYDIADNIRGVFNRRHNRPAATPDTRRSHWLGRRRAEGEWLYSDIEIEMQRRLAGVADRKPGASELAALIKDAHVQRVSNTLLNHVIAMRPVPSEFSEDQQKAIKAEVGSKPSNDESVAAWRKARNEAEQKWRARNRVAQGIVDGPARRFFGLQSFPSLARLFNFVVDVEIEFETFYAALGGPDNTDWGSAWLEAQELAIDLDASKLGSTGSTAAESKLRARYLLLAHADSGRAIWSTAKLREEHFWPVTCEEIEAQREILLYADADPGIPPQYDGIVDLGFEREDHKPRFELTNFDVVQALEHYTNASESRQAGRDGGAPVDRAGQGWGPLRTAGLAVIDTLRRDADVSDAAKTTERQKSVQAGNDAVLDANDLTVGYRIDVGVRPRGASHDHRFVWRSLMNRLVSYEDPRNIKRLKELLEQLKLGTEGTIRLDSGHVRTPSKLLVTDKNAGKPQWAPEKPSQAQAIANESFATWTGDPLALECGGPADPIKVDPALDMALSLTFDLPRDLPNHSKEDRESYTPPRLEFGRGYRLGMRAVYLGGVILPLERAAPRYELLRGGTLTLPAKGSNGHRLLRHEPIDAPLVAMAERVLHDNRNSDMPWDPTEMAVVRSGRDHRLGPSITWRVVVPPAVPMEFAVLHRLKNWSRTVGNPALGNRRLVDGLVNVDVDEEKGGFPYLDECRKNVLHPKDRKRLSKDTKQPIYDAVFKVKPTPDSELAKRRVPYYPDPASRRLVVELVTRRPDTKREDWVVVPLDDAGAGVHYPDYLPVVLEVQALDEAAEGKRKRILRYDPNSDVGILRAGGEFVAQPYHVWSGWEQSDGTVRARRVVVQLARGEDFDIRLWCAPLAEDVARWFDSLDKVVRSAQLIGRLTRRVNRSSSPQLAPMLNTLGLGKAALPDDADILEGVIALAGPDRTAEIRKRLSEDYGKMPAEYAGITQLDQVSFAVLRLMAEEVSDRSLEVPVPGVSHSRTIRVTHAIQQPRYAPCFVPLSGKPEAACENTENGESLIAVVRREFRDSSNGSGGAAAATTPTPSDNQTRADWLMHNTDPGQWNTLEHQGFGEGASDTVFGCRLAVDLDTTSQIAIWAQAAIVVDDVTRKRDRKLPPPPPEKTRQTYGFGVDADGNVDFGQIRSQDIHSPDNEVELIELLRTRDLSSEIAAKEVENRQILNLAFAPGNAVREFERRYRFTRPTARKLHLTLEARSRFEHLLVREVEAESACGLLPPQLPDHLTVLGARTTFWLPASKRPDPIDRKSLLPAFVWTEKAGGTEIERRTMVRIRMKRPWVCSGEGERLGIVLWPPEILDPSRRDEIAQDFARDPVNSTAGKVAYKQYGPFENSTATFDDTDLGPGGQFVTRWGNDPIRRGPVQTGWFMPLEAFRDAFPGSRNPTAEKVRDVFMPVPRGDKDDNAIPAPSTGAQSTMVVSLLTYKPKFDVVDELWYVDAEISPLALAYPFVRLGLVRYQRHAPPEWQVSEPIVEFVQLLPRRHVIVTLEPRHAMAEGYPVRVDVHGPGSDAVALREDPADIQAKQDYLDAGAKEDYLHRPVLKARVLRAPEGTNGYSGRAGDPIVPEITAVGLDGRLLKWDSASGGNGLQPRRGESGLEWSVRFVLKDNPRNILHHIFLEELEWMLPADPEAETRRQGRPSGSDSVIAETGPRFALRIRVGF